MGGAKPQVQVKGKGGLPHVAGGWREGGKSP